MHHVNLFLAAATVLLGSAVAPRAEPLPAANSTEIAARDLGPSENTVPANLTVAPTVPPSSPVAGIAMDPAIKGAPQVAKSDPAPHAVDAVVPPHRPVTHRARLGYVCAHPLARAAKRAAPQAAVWLASNESRYVLLGVGF